MTKADLKTGMRVKTRDGELYIFLKNVFIWNKEVDIFTSFGKNDGYIPLSDYSEDLTSSTDKSFDIMEVFAIRSFNKGYSIEILDPRYTSSIWVRKPKTAEEKIQSILEYIEDSGYTDDPDESNDIIDFILDVLKEE